MEVSVTPTPLLPGDASSHGLLQVTYRDFPVADPHLVNIKIWNCGSRDVATSTFDGGKAISISFDQVFYGITQVEGGVRVSAPALGSKQATVEVGPGLLKKGSVWAFSAVTSGPSQIAVDAPLIDTDLRMGPADNERRTAVKVQVGLLGITVPLGGFYRRWNDAQEPGEP